MLRYRLFALGLLLVSICLAFVAWDFQAPFSYEPVGPRAYPLLLLAILILGSVLLIIKPALETAGDHEGEALTRPLLIKAGICLVLFLLMAFFYEQAGFIVTSVIFAFAMARLFGGHWLASAVQAVILGVGLFLLFDRVLDVPLPLGLLSGLEI